MAGPERPHEPVPMGTAIFHRLAGMAADEWQPEELPVRVLPGRRLVQPEDHRTYGAGAELVMPVRAFRLHRELGNEGAVIALKVRLPEGAFWLAATREGRLAVQARELPLSTAVAIFDVWFDLNVWRAFQEGRAGWRAVAGWLGIQARDADGDGDEVRLGDPELLAMAIFREAGGAR